MNQKTIIGVLVVLLLVVGGYILWSKSSSDVKESEKTNSTTNSGTNGTSNGTSTNKQNETNINVNVNLVSPKDETVTFTSKGYSPSPLTIKKGTTVVFKNNSDLSVWTASAKHPTHNTYPTTGGCLGSTFDSCKGISPGGSWSFKFEVVGEWGYHDHLHPSFFGKIIVEE